MARAAGIWHIGGEHNVLSAEREGFTWAESCQRLEQQQGGNGRASLRTASELPLGLLPGAEL